MRTRVKTCELDICDGSGFIPVMGRVYVNEPLTANLGETEECVCRMPDPNDRIEDDYEDYNY